MVKFESWIDRQIREAIERGEFDDLPGAGKPIPNLGDRDEGWWIKAKLEREGLKPPLPETLQLRRERAEIQRTLADVRTEDQARAIVVDLNERIKESWLRRDAGPMIVVSRLNVDEVIAEWRRRRDAGGADS
ncbi:DnaJ family domain-containing protein [Enemella evansiae]|uniref:DnaJ family domain-containing protein n=1 Tax=Enemella evansiae TaxID=2016499 RepID=UPI000B971449|nr:DUF1992 domain-containing protein [Enemella evansiae]OYN93978.1 molecular chaperone DnaJ [Enemella evansiae]OYO06037.1 molecular chaperone DnaJ [Enemella evansiae]OYO09783.1 molecular chaperone DnaJ [Enemella evansiae]PFG68747.1 uncharacterized protein DUF1992 [Propionibacteriaceae bacterium ES.041]